MQSVSCQRSEDHDASDDQGDPGRPGGRRRGGHRRRLGAHPARLEGGVLVPPGARRLVLRPDPGRRRGGAAELSERGPPPHHALRRAGRGDAGRVAGEGAAVRGQGRRGSRWSAGSRTRTTTRSPPSGTRSSTCGPWRTCGRGPTPSAPSRGSATACRMAVHRYFHEHGFFWIHTPIITTSDAEGAGAMFRVSTLDLANLPRDEHGQDRLLGRLLRQAGQPDGLGPAQRRGLLPGPERASTPSARPSAPRTRTRRGTSPSSG